jgi:predicted PurR-regulated permease PerM
MRRFRSLVGWYVACCRLVVDVVYLFSLFFLHIVALFVFLVFILSEYLNYALDNRREWADKGGDIVNRLVQKFNGEGKNKDDKSKKEAEPKEDVKAVSDLTKTLLFGRQLK